MFTNTITVFDFLLKYSTEYSTDFKAPSCKKYKMVCKVDNEIQIEIRFSQVFQRFCKTQEI